MSRLISLFWEQTLISLFWEQTQQAAAATRLAPWTKQSARQIQGSRE